MNDQYRRSIGLPRQLQQARPVYPHPSGGGSRGYSPEMRQAEIQAATAGLPTTAHLSTIRGWVVRSQPYAMTGNKTQPQLSGLYLQAVRFHRQVWPRATADEVVALVAANVSPTIVFSRWQIYSADERLGLTSKRVSITASQALTFEAQTRRRLFWTALMPLGVFGVPLAELIDMDECVLYVETVSRPTGKAYKVVRIRDSGPYKVGEKSTLILAVDAQGLIHAKFMRSGSQAIPRPPHRPQDGPIEFIFNQLEVALQQHMYQVMDETTLVGAVHACISNLKGFRETFLHCGYVLN
ncbi:hypothetical protein B484DRAFT_337287 [Ochromonadaceae sp. CCMP2298]|nr:hypothetical protein B484DRAFT_337287 [Ochromonadaceae sp. CCMP2298]